jgi:hypothetical protein
VTMMRDVRGEAYARLRACALPVVSPKRMRPSGEAERYAAGIAAMENGDA